MGKMKKFIYAISSLTIITFFQGCLANTDDEDVSGNSFSDVLSSSSAILSSTASSSSEDLHEESSSSEEEKQGSSSFKQSSSERQSSNDLMSSSEEMTSSSDNEISSSSSVLSSSKLSSNEKISSSTKFYSSLTPSSSSMKLSSFEFSSSLEFSSSSDTLSSSEVFSSSELSSSSMDESSSSSDVVTSPITSANVYWVGHSLISHRDNNFSGSTTLYQGLEQAAESQGQAYDYHKHTIPGAPIGWNWNWNHAESGLTPLLVESDPQYGTFDVLVVTEGVNIESSFRWWSSGFYFRNFCAAAKKANPNARLYLYQSWHHYYASDRTFESYYGPMETFDWVAYMKEVEPIWYNIIDDASDPNVEVPGDYQYNGPGSDPGVSNDVFDISIIPTGEVLVKIIERLLENRDGDDWTFTTGLNGSTLTPDDFFANPFTDFPNDTTTTLYGGAVDDIHGSHVIIYLNILVHYAVIYQQNPVNIPAYNGVPDHIADIFKEVVWGVVTNNPRTGVTGN